MRSRKDLIPKRIFSQLVCLAAFAVVTFVSASSAIAGPWVEHVTKIPQLKREADDLEAQLKQLIKEKRATEEERAVSTQTAEIAQKYKQLKEVGERLEAETTHVRFKHPEQAEKLDRQYVRYKTKSLGDLEGEVGIDGKLDRIHAQVNETFPQPIVNGGKPVEPKINPFFMRKPASLEEANVPEKIILKK